MNKADKIAAKIQLALALAELTVDVIGAISRFADRYRCIVNEANENVALLPGEAEESNAHSDE